MTEPTGDRVLGDSGTKSVEGENKKVREKERGKKMGDEREGDRRLP